MIQLAMGPTERGFQLKTQITEGKIVGEMIFEF